MQSGLVIGNEGPAIQVELESGCVVQCRLRGRLRQKGKESNSVVIGDQVVVTEESGTASISQIKPRRCALRRPRQHGGTQIWAANIDQMIIVQSARQPAFKRRLVERFLVVAKRDDIPVVVVVNKCELEAENVLRSWLQPLQANDTCVLLTSAKTGQGIEELSNLLGQQLSVLVGQSGVGKTSLLNAMFPGMLLATQSVSLATAKGRHTTTTSRLYPLPRGGYLADTPGIRTLGLFEEDQDRIDDVFPEVSEQASNCKFNNCSHTHEPGCAVKLALEQGLIDEDRYQNYLRMSKTRGR